MYACSAQELSLYHLSSPISAILRNGFSSRYCNSRSNTRAVFQSHTQQRKHRMAGYFFSSEHSRLADSFVSEVTQIPQITPDFISSLKSTSFVVSTPSTKMQDHCITKVRTLQLVLQNRMKQSSRAILDLSLMRW